MISESELRLKKLMTGKEMMGVAGDAGLSGYG
jgi:hypothetical protein